MYLTVSAGGLVAFIFCSYWVYHFIDPEDDLDREDDYDYDGGGGGRLENFYFGGANDSQAPFERESQSAVISRQRYPVIIATESKMPRQRPFTEDPES